MTAVGKIDHSVGSSTVVIFAAVLKSAVKKKRRKKKRTNRRIFRPLLDQESVNFSEKLLIEASRNAKTGQNLRGGCSVKNWSECRRELQGGLDWFAKLSVKLHE